MKAPRFWTRMLVATSRFFGRSAMPDGIEDEEKRWEEATAAREAYFQAHIGPLPSDILKMADMFGVWVGGGLYVIHATKLQPTCWVHTTFGLSNVGLPTGVTNATSHVETDGKRVTRSTATLKKKDPAPQIPGAAGYGYEIMVLTHEEAEWPLWFLQWAVKAEMINDAGILNRVTKYDGFSVEKIGIGGGNSINVLIAKAQPPLPTGTALPNGKMDLLIATVITDEEMQWSFKHGRKALLNELLKSGIGQFSELKRGSVVK